MFTPGGLVIVIILNTNPSSPSPLYYITKSILVDDLVSHEFAHKILVRKVYKNSICFIENFWYKYILYTHTEN